MALLKFLKGNYSNLNNATINEGQILICGDTGEMFVDVAADKRVKIGDFITVANIDALEALDATAVPTSRLYYVEDGNILARSNGTSWVQVNKQKTADELKTMLGLGSLAYLSEVTEANLSAELAEKVNAASEGNHAHLNKDVLDDITAENVKAWGEAEANAKAYTDELAEAIKDGTTIDSFADVEAELAKKVDAVDGKGLSTNDLTDELKGQYDAAYQHSIADHAPTNAQANVIEGIKVNGTEQAITDKVVDITVPTKVSDLTNDADYATKAEAQAMADAKDDAIAEAKKAGTDAAAALEAYKTTNDKAISDHIADAEGKYETKTDAAQKLTDAKKYTDDAIAAIPAQTDYTVTITEDTTDSTIAKRYIFSQLGEEIGRIDLAKELVVTSGTVGEVTEAGKPYDGAVVGDKYIELVIANQDAPIYIPAKDLVDIYTAKDGATEVQVAISNTNEISATLVNGGVTEAKLATDVQTKLNKTWEEVGVAQSLVDALEDGQVKTNKEAIEAINNESTGILAQAKSYAEGLADNYAPADHNHDDKYDAKGDAAQALEDAKAYADGLADNYAEAEHDHVVADITDFESAVATKVESYGYATTDYADQAEADAIAAAKTETENQVKALAEGTVATNAAAIAKNAEDIANKANSADVYAKTETFTQDEVNAAIEAAVTEACTWGSF